MDDPSMGLTITNAKVGRITKDYTLLNPPLGKGMNIKSILRRLRGSEEGHPQTEWYDESSENNPQGSNQQGRARETNEWSGHFAETGKDFTSHFW